MVSEDYQHVNISGNTSYYCKSIIFYGDFIAMANVGKKP